MLPPSMMWRAVQLAILAFVGLSLAIFITTPKPPMVGPPPGTPPSSELHGRAECGHDWIDSVRVDQIVDIIDVPEFHDCQRFIVTRDSAFVYDSLFAVFAADSLAIVEKRLGTPVQIAAQPGSSAYASLIGRLRAVVVAVVVAGGPYDSLGIQKDLNCVYVWRYLDPDVRDREVWNARMVSRGMNKSCKDTNVGALASLGPGMNLRVERAQVGDFRLQSDYPPVTRWDWDAVHTKQYLGLACGAAWCEIHNTDLAPSAALSVSAGATRDQARVRRIKGWYDQQYLAETRPNGSLRPSRILGTVVAVPDLGRKSKNDFESGYVHVANIELQSALGSTDPALQKYREKFNFEDRSLGATSRLMVRGTEADAMWRGQVVLNAGSAPPSYLNRKIMRRPVSTTFLSKGYIVPAVARWRWMKNDEGTWIQCTMGCCEMSDYDYFL